MVCRIIWADGGVPRGTDAAIGYKKLAIVTIKKICKESTKRFINLGLKCFSEVFKSISRYKFQLSIP